MGCSVTCTGTCCAAAAACGQLPAARTCISTKTGIHCLKDDVYKCNASFSGCTIANCKRQAHSARPWLEHDNTQGAAPTDRKHDGHAPEPSMANQLDNYYEFMTPLCNSGCDATGSANNLISHLINATAVGLEDSGLVPAWLSK